MLSQKKLIDNNNTYVIYFQIDNHFHYLDIHGVESIKPNRLSLTVGEKTYNFLTTGEPDDSREVDAMVLALATAIRNIFPTVPLL